MVLINQINISQLGAEFEKGVNNQLLKEATFKPRYQYNWADQNGIEYDNTEVLKKEQLSYQLSIIVFGGNKVDVINKRNVIMNHIKSAEGFMLESTSILFKARLRFVDSPSSDFISTDGKWLRLIVNVVNNWEV